jgi:phosphoglycolate phosphatase-like HAD superfamily hydrolase
VTTLRATADHRDRPIAFDFDGVLCDGTIECAAITWSAWTRRGLTDVEDELDEVPADFREGFLALRGYARHLGHFIVPLVADGVEIADQESFDACYAAVDPATVARFVETAEAHRARVRKHRRGHWLAQHRVYPGLTKLLAVLRHWYVVTAKDDESVTEILCAQGVAIGTDRVYGNLVGKTPALADIAQRHGLPNGDVVVIDDSVANVIAARADGYDARWATWGFHTPAQRRVADTLSLPQLALTDLGAQLGVGTLGAGR